MVSRMQHALQALDRDDDLSRPDPSKHAIVLIVGMEDVVKGR